MKIYILHTTITEQDTCATIMSKTEVYATKELAQEVIDLSAHWSGIFNESIDYSIEEVEIITAISRDALIAAKAEEDARCQARFDYYKANDSYNYEDSDFPW
jgi:hypothetical protein